MGDHFIENTTVTNTGDEDIDDVNVIISYNEADVKWVKGSQSTGTYVENDDGTVTWTISTLFAGTSEYYWDELMGVETEVVNITANAYDGDRYDDGDTAEVTIVESTEPNPEPVNAETVEMQNTGTPLAPLVLAIMVLLGGYGLTMRK